jgi:hypothetical protein
LSEPLPAEVRRSLRSGVRVLPDGSRSVIPSLDSGEPIIPDALPVSLSPRSRSPGDGRTNSGRQAAPPPSPTASQMRQLSAALARGVAGAGDRRTYGSEGVLLAQSAAPDDRFEKAGLPSTAGCQYSLDAGPATAAPERDGSPLEFYAPGASQHVPFRLHRALDALCATKSSGSANLNDTKPASRGVVLEGAFIGGVRIDRAGDGGSVIGSTDKQFPVQQKVCASLRGCVADPINNT